MAFRRFGVRFVVRAMLRLFGGGAGGGGWGGVLLVEEAFFDRWRRRRKIFLQKRFKNY